MPPELQSIEQSQETKLQKKMYKQSYFEIKYLRLKGSFFSCWHIDSKLHISPTANKKKYTLFKVIIACKPNCILLNDADIFLIFKGEDRSWRC